MPVLSFMFAAYPRLRNGAATPAKLAAGSIDKLPGLYPKTNARLETRDGCAARLGAIGFRTERKQRIAWLLPSPACGRRWPSGARPDEGKMAMREDETPRLRRFAKAMRREPTEAEERLWGALRGRRLDRLKFRRQVPISGYIADFVCAGPMLIVEVDGSQHAGSAHDAIRDRVLEEAGYEIVRFWNDDVMRDLDNVCQHIMILARARMK